MRNVKPCYLLPYQIFLQPEFFNKYYASLSHDLPKTAFCKNQKNVSIFLFVKISLTLTLFASIFNYKHLETNGLTRQQSLTFNKTTVKSVSHRKRYNEGFERKKTE